MAIPAKGLNQLRTLSGRVDQLSLPYRSYMQITCLEMERARRNMERKSASQRVALIDARCPGDREGQTRAAPGGGWFRPEHSGAPARP